MSFPVPEAALKNHIAVLGKTGSGKSSTAKLIIEHVAEDDARVCVLDSVKSDWWGLISSADGKRPGLPFKIIGGPHGHVPLHASAGRALGEIVGSGKLPLSIIDMADFKPGELQKFFIAFAPALLKSVRGVLYLVMEEAHEFAPKERSNIGQENEAIYYAKKLATAGRSKGIRLIVVTQRTQSLHNALLGSCETLIAHRFTTPADQEPVVKWLKANADKEIVKEIERDLSSIPTGSGWVCSGEARVFEKIKFPRIKTYDNSATPDNDDVAHDVKSAPVNQTELRDIIGDAVKEAEANDPKALRAEIARLTAALRKAELIKPAESNVGDVAAAEKRGYERGHTEGFMEGEREGRRVMLVQVKDHMRPLIDHMNALHDRTEEAAIALDRVGDFLIEAGNAPTSQAKTQSTRFPKTAAQVTRIPKTRANGHIEAPLQRIIDAIRWWNVMGVSAPSHPQVGFVAGYSHKSGTWATYLSRLRSLDLIAGRGDLMLTEKGEVVSNTPPEQPSGDLLRATVLKKVDGPLGKILAPIMDAYPDAMTHVDAAEQAGYSHQSGTWATYLSRLRSLELIDGRGALKAQDWLFP